MSALSGKRILVTRSSEQAPKLAAELELRGAHPIVLPVIKIAPPESFEGFDRALAKLDAFDWIVFTSVNAVNAFASRLQDLATVLPSACRLAVVGSATAEALAEAFRAPDATPEEYLSASIAAELGPLEGRSVLLPRGDLATNDLPEELRRRGAVVEECIAYRTQRVESPTDVPTERPDAITLTSGEAARATVACLRAAGREEWLNEVPLVCIGPVTAKALENLGLKSAETALLHTISGLADALEHYFHKTRTYA